MNLVLIGYRGTGKTTLSEMLHERAGLPVYHLDEMLEARFGEKIADFVRRNGWDEFRNEEELLVAELSALEGVILDTGGGAVLREKNRINLRKNSFIVWLESSPKTIAYYIGDDASRPSLTGSKTAVEEITEVLAARTPLYAELADCRVATDAMPLGECADLILTKWKEYHETLETL